MNQCLNCPVRNGETPSLILSYPNLIIWRTYLVISFHAVLSAKKTGNGVPFLKNKGTTFPPLTINISTDVNSRSGMHVLRTERFFVTMSEANQYEVGRGADTRDQLTLCIIGSTCSGQITEIRSVHVLRTNLYSPSSCKVK